MTIDEAIKICEEDAEKIGGNPQSDRHAERCKQLAEWLTDYKGLREENINLKNEIERLRDCVDNCVHNGELDFAELKEAKRLLKFAIEDFDVYGSLKDLPSEPRVQNPNWRRFNRVFDILDHRWRYTDEVLKLLHEEGKMYEV